MAESKGQPATRDVAGLIAHVEGRHGIQHEWGRHKNDCVGFVLDAVKAQTGHGRASKLRWHDEKSGLKLIKKLGGLEKAFDSYFQRIPPALAQRGDIAGVPDPDIGLKVMLIEGDTLVCPGDRGNARLPRSRMTTAWSAVLPAPKKSKR